MQEFILETNGLLKSFDQNVALDYIDIKIPKGKIFGLLGPNGAGKTTLIRIITQIFDADKGSVIFNGQPLSKSNIYDIGYMPEERGLYKKMRVGEQLLYLARLRNLSNKEAKQRIEYWFERLDIDDWWDKKVEELSKGMQQKIQFISTVLHHPKLLILDEPFSGLDPVNANLIKNEIALLHEQGTSIIFSTHRMEQVEQVCEHIALINKGKLLLDGSVHEIQNRFKKNHYVIQFEGNVTEAQIPKEFKLLERDSKTLKFALNQQQDSNGLIKALLNSNIEIHGVTEILPSLNEIFIQQVESKSATLKIVRDE